MAIGFFECNGFGIAVYSIDKACKASDVKILGIDTINPKTDDANIPLQVQVKINGSISNVEEALKIAKEEALKFEQTEDVTIRIINNPYGGTVELSKINKIEEKNKNKK